MTCYLPQYLYNISDVLETQNWDPKVKLFVVLQVKATTARHIRLYSQIYQAIGRHIMLYSQSQLNSHAQLAI